MSFKYDAFFSYRHKPLDQEITQKTFNLVESYRLPKPLVAKGCEEVQRAFRDTEELPVSRILTDTIDQALRSTKCLIVVCSTDTPSSASVQPAISEMARRTSVSALAIILRTSLSVVRMSMIRSAMSGTSFRDGGKECSGSPVMSSG